MKRFIFLPFVLLLSCTSTPQRDPATASAASRAGVDCGSGQSHGQSYRYCMTRPSRGTKSRDVLYYLHGNGGNEASWDVEDHQKIEKLWAEAGKDAPTIITVSFGSYWMLSQEDGLFSGSIFDAFFQGAMPALEAQLGFKIERRLALGESMGGFNASQLLLKAPKMFARVAIVCPAILTFGPQAPDSEVEAYIARHQPYVRVDLVDLWRKKMRKSFSTPDLWREHDPLLLAQQTNSSFPPVFLLGDGHDAFGFIEAAERLHETFQSRGLKHEWHEIKDGGHCQQTPESLKALAKFLSETN